MEVNGQLHAAAALPPGEGPPNGHQSRSGRSGEENKSLLLPGIEPRLSNP